MGGSGQPYMYDAPKKDPLEGFNPRSVTEASRRGPAPPKPKQEGPLVNFNRHPDSYIQAPYGQLDAKLMSPKTKGVVKWTRWFQFFLRLLQLLGAMGMMVAVIFIRGTQTTEGWIIRIPPGADIVVSAYAVYHLFRPAKARTPASSASYHFFALVLDSGFVPFYVFIAIMTNTNYRENWGDDGRWRTFFGTEEQTNKVLFSTWLGAIAIGGLHVVTAIISLFLVVVFRKISNLPPDMNPLEENLTSRRSTKHKHKNSEMTVSTTSDPRSSIISSLSANSNEHLIPDSRTIPFIHTRKNSDYTYNPHNPQSARQSRVDLTSQRNSMYQQPESQRSSRYYAQGSQNNTMYQQPQYKRDSMYQQSEYKQDSFYQQPSSKHASKAQVDNVYSGDDEPLSQRASQLAAQARGFSSSSSEYSQPAAPTNKVAGRVERSAYQPVDLSEDTADIGGNRQTMMSDAYSNYPRNMEPPTEAATIEAANTVVKRQSQALQDNWFVSKNSPEKQYKQVRRFSFDDSDDDQSDDNEDPFQPSGPVIQQQQQPLRMNPPTPPNDTTIKPPAALNVTPLKQSSSPKPSPQQHQQRPRSSHHTRNQSTTTPTNIVNAYSPPKTNFSNMNNSPKSRFYGDFKTATANLRPVSSYSSDSPQAHPFTAHSPQKPSPKKSYGENLYRGAERQGYTHESVGKSPRVVSRTGIDEGDLGLLGAMNTGMKGANGPAGWRRREVSGKVAEEGRGAAVGRVW